MIDDLDDEALAYLRGEMSEPATRAFAEQLECDPDLRVRVELLGALLRVGAAEAASYREHPEDYELVNYADAREKFEMADPERFQSVAAHIQRCRECRETLSLIQSAPRLPDVLELDSGERVRRLLRLPPRRGPLLAVALGVTTMVLAVFLIRAWHPQSAEEVRRPAVYHRHFSIVVGHDEHAAGADDSQHVAGSGVTLVQSFVMPVTAELQELLAAGAEGASNPQDLLERIAALLPGAGERPELVRVTVSPAVLSAALPIVPRGEQEELAGDSVAVRIFSDGSARFDLTGQRRTPSR